jgi:hypothetical protein
MTGKPKVGAGYEPDEFSRETGLSLRPSGDPLLEFINDCGDELRQLKQRWDNRLVFEGLSLPEKYREGRLHISLDINLDILSSGEIKAYRVQYSALPHDHVDLIMPVVDEQAAIDNNVCDSDVRNAECRKNKKVLVCDIKLVESPDGVIPSSVRGYLISDTLNYIGSTLQYSILHRCYKMVPIVEESELRFISRDAAYRFDHRAVTDIERRADIVDRIADDKWNFPSERLVLAQAPDPLIGLDIILQRDAVEARSCEGSKIGAKYLDVMIGPFDL